MKCTIATAFRMSNPFNYLKFKTHDTKIKDIEKDMKHLLRSFLVCKDVNFMELHLQP